MYIHNLDPVFVELGFLSIRWYSLAYIFGILIGWWYGKKIINKRFEVQNYYVKHFDDLITYVIISIIIGGRVGYILFYNLKYYLSNPLDILKVWEGGMSFHGALLGIVIGTYLFSKRRNIPSLILLDIIACVSPIGIFLGRIANFINGELVGKISNVPWSVIFPNVDMMPRHPSQLYEALLEGLILFVILRILINKNNYMTGTCSYVFLICYGVFRVFSEFFREPDSHIGYLFNTLSMGTLLSLIMILLTFKAAFAPADSVAQFKMQEYGMPKADWATFSPATLVVGLVLPALERFHYRHILKQHLYVVRFFVNLVLQPNRLKTKSSVPLQIWSDTRLKGV